MKARIEDLADEANWWKPLSLPSDWNDGDYVVSEEQMKRFAELVVQKCLNVLAAEMNRPVHHRRVMAAQGMVIAQAVIKNNFGIE